MDDSWRAPPELDAKAFSVAHDDDSRGGRARSGMQGGSHGRCGLSGRRPRSMQMGEVAVLRSM
jgi:hypothetical protein